MGGNSSLVSCLKAMRVPIAICLYQGLMLVTFPLVFFLTNFYMFQIGPFIACLSTIIVIPYIKQLNCIA